MISLDHTQILTLQIEGEDIHHFVNIVGKLSVSVTQAGFKKTFTMEEGQFIKELVSQMGLDITQEMPDKEGK